MTPESIVALMGGSVVVGAILLQIVTSWLKRGDLRIDEATAIRLELRAQNAALLVRIDAGIARIELAERELETWKVRYFTLQELYATEKTIQSTLTASMQREIDNLKIERETLMTKTIVMQKEIDLLQVQVKALQEKRDKPV